MLYQQYVICLWYYSVSEAGSLAAQTVFFFYIGAGKFFLGPNVKGKSSLGSETKRPDGLGKAESCFQLHVLPDVFEVKFINNVMLCT